MKRVLLTGGTGFVGANLARRLLADGHELNLLVRAGFSDWRIREIRDQLAIHIVDMRQSEEVETLVRRIKPDWVFHLAAHGAYSFQNDPLTIVQTNYLCTVNLVLACVKIGVEIMVNVGSSSEYGFKDHAPAEDEATEPNSYYATTKAAATQFCRYAARTHKVAIPTLRLYSVYGPYEDPRRFIPTLIIHALEKRWPPLVNPETGRDFVFVEDVNNAFLALASQRLSDPGAVYNLGTGSQTSIRQVVEIAANLFDVKVQPSWGSMPQRSWDTNTWVSNPKRISSELGWVPKVDIRHGLDAVVQWLKAHPEWLEFYRHQILPSTKA